MPFGLAQVATEVLLAVTVWVLQVALVQIFGQGQQSASDYVGVGLAACGHPQPGTSGLTLLETFVPVVHSPLGSLSCTPLDPYLV